MFKKGVHSAVFYTHCVKVFGILQFLPYCVEEIGLSAVVGSLCYHTALQKERYGVAHCVQFLPAAFQNADIIASAVSQTALRKLGCYRQSMTLRSGIVTLLTIH